LIRRAGFADSKLFVVALDHIRRKRRLQTTKIDSRTRILQPACRERGDRGIDRPSCWCKTAGLAASPSWRFEPMPDNTAAGVIGSASALSCQVKEAPEHIKLPEMFLRGFQREFIMLALLTRDVDFAKPPFFRGRVVRLPPSPHSFFDGNSSF